VDCSGRSAAPILPLIYFTHILHSYTHTALTALIPPYIPILILHSLHSYPHTHRYSYCTHTALILHSHTPHTGQQLHVVLDESAALVKIEVQYIYSLYTLTMHYESAALVKIEVGNSNTAIGTIYTAVTIHSYTTHHMHHTVHTTLYTHTLYTPHHRCGTATPPSMISYTHTLCTHHRYGTATPPSMIS
jgi:hypothetical protein